MKKVFVILLSMFSLSVFGETKVELCFKTKSKQIRLLSQEKLEQIVSIAEYERETIGTSAAIDNLNKKLKKLDSAQIQLIKVLCQPL